MIVSMMADLVEHTILWSNVTPRPGRLFILTLTWVKSMERDVSYKTRLKSVVYIYSHNRLFAGNHTFSPAYLII